MAIINTITENFDWAGYNSGGVSSQGSFQFINDQANKAFTDTGGIAAMTGGAKAFQNWRILGRNQAASYNQAYTAMVGETKQNNGESCLSYVNDGAFTSDGMMQLSYRPWNAEGDSLSWAGNYTDISENQSYVMTFHSDHESGEGIPPHEFYPLFSYTPQGQAQRGAWKDWRVETDIDTYATNVMSNTTTVDGGEFGAAGKWRLGPHLNYPSMRTCAHGDEISTLYSSGATYDAYKWDSNLGSIDYGKPSFQEAARDMVSYRSCVPQVVWYAHDGSGNGMLILTPMQGGGTATRAGDMWGNSFGATYKEAYAYNLNNGLPDKSGMMIHSLPDKIKGITDSKLDTIDQWTRDRNNRIIPHPDAPTAASWLGYTAASYAYHNGNYIMNGYNFNKVLSFKTPMGTADEAALKTPMNFYFWLGTNRGGRNHWRYGKSNSGWKFGNMVMTDQDPFHAGNTGKAQSGSAGFESNRGHAPELKIIASLAGRITVPKVSWGQQTGFINPYTTAKYVEFPGIGATYDAMPSGAVVGVGIKSQDLTQWTNPIAITDGQSSTSTICKATGLNNALMINMQGSQEGTPPDDSDEVKSVTINVSGVAKLILGPQVLKIAIYDDENQTALLAGPLEIYSAGSDSPSGAQQVVFTGAELGANNTYGFFKDAWIAIYAESPVV